MREMVQTNRSSEEKKENAGMLHTPGKELAFEIDAACMCSTRRNTITAALCVASLTLIAARHSLVVAVQVCDVVQEHLQFGARDNYLIEFC